MKKQYIAPVLEKVKSSTVVVACKKAACSSNSTHTIALK